MKIMDVLSGRNLKYITNLFFSPTVYSEYNVKNITGHSRNTEDDFHIYSDKDNLHSTETYTGIQTSY